MTREQYGQGTLLIDRIYRLRITIGRLKDPGKKMLVTDSKDNNRFDGVILNSKQKEWLAEEFEKEKAKLEKEFAEL